MKQTYIPIPSHKQSFEAVKWTGTNQDEIVALLDHDGSKVARLISGDLVIKTSQSGFIPIVVGYYVLKYPEGAIEIGQPQFLVDFMPIPIAVEAEFIKQREKEDKQHERERVLRSGDVLFR